ncbi:Uncharacterised protein [Mycobacteroides abscessus subsp. bolletii]|nr:Uncharacterised protein [Mycobacteroides abscessus subsp. bolletii]
MFDPLFRAFEHWNSLPSHPTLTRQFRTVYVNMLLALPGCVDGAKTGIHRDIKTHGLIVNRWMKGTQLAWIRTTSNRWLGIVEVPTTSGNGWSEITMRLWLPPTTFQATKPPDVYL